MSFRNLAALGSVLMFTSSALASPPRVHRGPTAPKLFKTRTLAPKPRETASAETARPAEGAAGEVANTGPQTTPVEAAPASEAPASSPANQ